MALQGTLRQASSWVRGQREDGCKELRDDGDPGREGRERMSWLSPVVYTGSVSIPVLGISCAAKPHKEVPHVSGKEADGAGSCGSRDA